MIDNFRLWGSRRCRQMGRHLSDGGWRSNMAATLLRTTPVSQRAEPSSLWWGTSPKRRIRRGTTQIARVGCGKAKRGYASRVPPFVRRNGAPHERGAGGESDPTLLTAGAARGRPKVAAPVAALCPPCGEVALTTVILAGRLKCRRTGPGLSGSTWPAPGEVALLDLVRRPTPGG